MNKNIEINFFNGSGYDILYPKTLAGNISAGTFSGNFIFANNVSCNQVATSNNHLVRKDYVDNSIQTAIQDTWGGSY